MIVCTYLEMVVILIGIKLRKEECGIIEDSLNIILRNEVKVLSIKKK